MDIKIQEVAEHLSQLVQVESLSDQDMDKMDFAPFEKIRTMLKTMYPKVHQKAEVEVINQGALLYHFKAEKKSDKEPLLFMAHMDVVPVAENTKDQWQVDGFSGLIENEIVWGRGTRDMKNQLVCFFEATEQALKEGFERDYDLYFCLGFDEENGGFNGTKAIAEVLRQRGIKLGMVLDEGGVISDGILGLKEEIALIGTCEKGFLALRIHAKDAGGHSSMPPLHTALGKICEAGVKLEKNQMPMVITEPLAVMLEKLSDYLSGTTKLALKNHTLFSPLVKKALAASPDSNALARTTTALTMAKGADANNILPNIATLTVNFRILPGQTVEDVLNHVKALLGDEFDYEIEMQRSPSRISKIDHRFELVSSCMKKAYPQLAQAVPFIMVGGTDSIYFDDLCEHIYKFGPFRCNKEERAMLHGINECIRFSDLEMGVKYFYYILHEYQ